MTVPSNLWDDSNEPTTVIDRISVLIRYPNDMPLSSVETAWARVELEDMDDPHSDTHLVTFADWYWFGIRKPRSYKLPEDQEKYDALKQLCEWLQEWELIEKMHLGPEDWEWQATHKLYEIATTPIRR